VIPGGLRGLVDRVYKESGMEAEFKKKEDDPDHERAANVEELINVAAEFDRNNPFGTLDDFLAQITLASDVDRIKDAGGAVTLMTLHAAKGLEFPWVAVVGMEDGLIPHGRAINFGSNPDEMEEERRLAFVGITRAMRQLTLSQARYRMVRGETVRTIESQFLREMPMECFEIVDLTGGGGAHDVPGSGGYRDESGYGRRAQQQRQTESAQDRAYGQALAGKSGGAGGGGSGGGFKRGMLVRHLQFGMGRIEDVSPASGAIRVVIKFTGGGTKTLISPPAKLERVDT
ncbi:MAG: 3'-5' exonuclease, partial [Phycisphaerae bacterium]